VLKQINIFLKRKKDLSIGMMEYSSFAKASEDEVEKWSGGVMEKWSVRMMERMIDTMLAFCCNLFWAARELSGCTTNNRVW